MSTAITVPAKDLIAGLKAVKHAIGDIQRPILHGVCFEGDDAGFRLVTADNYRIAIYELIASADLGEQAEAVAGFGRRVVWAEQVPVLLLWLKALGKYANVAFQPIDLGLEFTGNRVRLTVDVIDGTFPSYEKVLPTDPARVFSVNPQYIADAGRAHGVTAIPVAVAAGLPWEPVVITAGNLREIIMPALVGDDYNRRREHLAAQQAERDTQAAEAVA